MDAKNWRQNIKKHTEGAGTYRKDFQPVIDTLADILEQRDKAFEEYLEDGGGAVVRVISDRGATNYRKNPRLQVWSDLNTQALAYWKELGLTPSGLKKINEKSLIIKEKKGLADVLDNLGI